MKANYHTHTWRCHHATGTEEAYVRSAQGAGLETLGFSDHSPYLFPDGYYSTFRMRPEQLEEYTRCILELKPQFPRMEIHVGLETEYYPKFFPELLAMLRDQPVEYLLLGQHFIHNELDGVYAALPTGDRDVLETYCRQSIDAMHTGVYTYFAHPDIINFQGDNRLYGQWMRVLIREAKDCGVPLELNFLGLKTHRNYPDRRFLEIVAQEGCAMVLGCDAHEPEALADSDTEKDARALLVEYGIPVLETVTLRKI